MLNSRKKINIFVILTAIILFHIINNYIWLKYDNTYLSHDSHRHYLLSLGFFNEIKHNLIPSLSNTFDRVIMSRWHGVFVPFITAPFYFIFGNNQDTAVMINSTLFLIILIFSTYCIGKTIFNKKAGLLAAFIVSMYPSIFNHLRIYMLDLPLAAMVSLSIFLLIKTKFLSNRIYSVLFSISFGLGILTKFNFVGFIAGPLFFILFKVFIKERKYIKKNILYDILIAACIIFVLTFSFIKLKFWEILFRFYESSWLNPNFFSIHKSLFSLILYWLWTGFEHIVWISNAMIDIMVSFFFFVVFFVGLISLFKKKTEYKIILYLWLFLPVIFLSFLFHYPKVARYLIPILPAVAIISGGGIAHVKFLTLKRAIILLVIFFGCFQYFAISYCRISPLRVELPSPNCIPGLKNKYFQKIALSQQDIQIFRHHMDAFSFPMQYRQWPGEEMAEVMIKEIKYPYPILDIFFVNNISEIYEPLEYIVSLKGYPINIWVNFLFRERLYKQRMPPLILLEYADYIVILDDTGHILSSSDSLRRQFAEERAYFFKKIINDCILIKAFKLDYGIYRGKKALLFKKKKEYIKLEKSATNLYFRDGRCQWYYKGIAITEDSFGGGFKFKGEYYRASQAEWNIEKISADRIIATGRWQNVPIIQEWEFDIVSDKELVVNIRIISIDETQIQDMFFSLPLQHYYKEWETPEKKGRFSGKNIWSFTDSTDMYLPEMTEWLTVSSNKRNIFPNVTFIPISHQFKILPIISYKKDRRDVKFMINQYHDNTLSLSPGNYDCLSVKILLN